METIQCSKCGAVFEKTGAKDKLRRFKDKRFMTTFHCPNCDARVILKKGEEPITMYLKRLERLKEQAKRLGDNQEVRELQDEIDQINGEMKMNAEKTKDKKFSVKGKDAYDPTTPKNIAKAKALSVAQGKAASDEEAYDPLDPENILKEKELAKARGAAAADVKDALFKGQKVTAIKSEQGLREGEVYTVLGEEAIIKQIVGENDTTVYKLQDSSGNVIVIESPEGLFYEVKDGPNNSMIDAYDDGYEAAKNGKPISDNPFKDRSRSGWGDLKESWDDGWRNGNKNKDSKTKDKEEENESLKVKIGDIRKNMDAARKMGYDTEPYKKEIDKLECGDEERDQTGAETQEIAKNYRKLNRGFAEYDPEFAKGYFKNKKKTKDEWTEEEIKKRMKRISEEIDKIVLSGGVVGLGDPLSIEYGRLKSKLKNKTKDDNSKNGYYAAMTGKARTDNPFPKGTPENQKWDSDWKIGSEDFKYESNKELFKPKDSDDKELKEMLVNDAPDYYGAIVATARRGNNPQMGSKEVRKNLEPFMSAHGVQFNEEEFNKAYKEFNKAGVSKAAFMKGTDADDFYTKDPLTKKGEKILAAMKKAYGEEKGEQIFYASKNKGTISGVDSGAGLQGACGGERKYDGKGPRFGQDEKTKDDYKVRECPNCKNPLTYAGEENGKTKYKCELCGKSFVSKDKKTKDKLRVLEFNSLSDWEAAVRKAGGRPERSSGNNTHFFAYLSGNRVLGEWNGTKGVINFEDSKTKDGSLDEIIRKMAREKADVPYNDDGTIRTSQQAQLAYEQWYKIIKSRYKNDSRYAAEYGDSKTKDAPSINDPVVKNQIRVALKTLKMPSAMLGVMGGMTKEQAKEILRKYGVKFEDSKTKDQKIDKKFIASCPACQEMRAAGLSYEETHSSHTPGMILVEVNGREKEIPNPHITKDQEIKIIIGDDPVTPSPAEQKVEGNDVIYKEYTLKQLPETGEFEVYAPGGSIIGHAKALELAKLFVDRIVASRVGDEWSEEARKKL